MNKFEDEIENRYVGQFEQFYLNCAPELIFFARKFVSKHVAEDIVQDAFLKVWNNKEFLIDDKGSRSYLFRMVQNSCYDYLKHQSIENNYVSEALVDLKLKEIDFYDDPVAKLIRNEEIRTVRDAIDTLPPKCREIFIKAYIEKKKHTEIAALLQISVRTVEAQVYKALNLLRKILITILLCVFYGFL